MPDIFISHALSYYFIIIFLFSGRSWSNCTSVIKQISCMSYFLSLHCSLILLDLYHSFSFVLFVSRWLVPVSGHNRMINNFK